MWRKREEHEQELEGVVQRLRNERPGASPLELDRAKMTAMARAKAASGSSTGARRLVVAGLTASLMAAGAGGVLAAGGGNHSTGNAAQAEYSSSQCDVNNNNNNNIGSGNGNGNGNKNGNGKENRNKSGNGNGNGNGNESGNENNNFNCNENSFNRTNITNENSFNSYFTSTTVTITVSSSHSDSAVLGTKSVKKSKLHLRVHFFAAHGKKLKRVMIAVNGKTFKVLKGHAAAINFDFVGKACSTSNKITVVITGVLLNGKKVSETRHFTVC